MDKHYELSNGYTVLGFVIGLAINRISSIDTGIFSLEVVLTIINAVWVIFNIYYCFGVFPKLLINDRMDNASSAFNLDTENGLKLVSFCNGFSALIFGFLFNYNMKNNKVGISCYVIGCLEVVVLIFIIVLLFI